MDPHDIRERIELLLRATDARDSDVLDTLTAGYGYALSLDSQRLRIERRISELAAHAGDPEAARELRSLWLRSRTIGAELAEVRALLRNLREVQLVER